jgi:hypothetical protein
MNINKKISARSLMFFLPALLLWGCGGSESNNKSSLPVDVAPVAVAEVLGTSINNGQANVRSGSDVLLTGQNSKGNDDPILHYQWEQIDSSGFKVDLYERATNAVAFTAPNIPSSNTQGVNLKFRLTVIDSDGIKATSDISILVQAIKDAKHFLTLPSVENKVAAYVTANKDDVIASDIPVTLEVKAVASWLGRDGNNHQANILTKNFSGLVPAGKVEAINSNNNLMFAIDLPELNVDEINKQFKGDARLSRLEFEHVQAAQITLSFQLQQSTGSPLSVYLADFSGDEILDVAALQKPQFERRGQSVKNQKPILMGAGSPATVDLDVLRQALSLDSKLSVNNYYTCLDPSEKTKTFDGWLAGAGFTGKDDGDVNTKYINNYDLGFGRDMHMRQDKNGNVYSYVINYPTLENTLHNRNEFAIVAMEYSAIPTGNCGDIPAPTDVASTKKVVKFFAYVPDQKNGGYVRSDSMNFDGRGEKYLPGVCTACHYGNNNTKEFSSTGKILATNADLDSSFMPWDLDSLLYTQASNPHLTDPVFTKTADLNAAEQKQYSRETQEALFKQQNQMVLHTFTEDTKKILRFAQPIKQLHGWYGNAAERAAVEALNFGDDTRTLPDANLLELQRVTKTLPSGSFDGTYVPKGWRGDKAQEALYVDVYERNCRMCHLFTPNVKFDFDNYNEFVAHPSLKNYVYEQGLMPLSRLTMDRFWLNFNGGDSAAKKLRDHLNNDSNLDNNVAEQIIPGAPVAIVSPAANPKATADVEIDFDGNVLFDGGSSLFAETYQWTLNDSKTVATQKYKFAPIKPGETHKIELQVTTGDSQSPATTRRVLVENHKPDIANIPTQSVLEGGETSFNLYQLLCPDAAVDDKSCRAIFGDIQKGKAPTITVAASVKNGVVSNVNSTTGNLTFKSTAAQAAGDGEFVVTIADSFGEVSNPKTVKVTINTLAAPSIGAPDKCSVSARTTINQGQYPITFNSAPCPDPKANDTAAPGLSLVINSVDLTSTKGGVVSLNGGVISYTPPANYVGNDSFTYQVVDNSLSKKTSQGTVSVTVNPKVTFASISNSINTTCPSCHLASTTALGPNWRIYSVFKSYAGGLGSDFMAYPCGAPSHAGGNRICNSSLNGASPNSIDQLNDFGKSILTWLEEGGLNN